MRFEIRQSKRNKQWRGYFIGANNEKVWLTEQYKRFEDAESAVNMLNVITSDSFGERRFPVVVRYADGTISEEN